MRTVQEFEAREIYRKCGSEVPLMRASNPSCDVGGEREKALRGLIKTP